MGLNMSLPLKGPMYSRNQSMCISLCNKWFNSHILENMGS